MWAALWFLSEVESGSPSPHLFVCHHRLILLIRGAAGFAAPTTEAAKKRWLAPLANRQYLFLVTQFYFSHLHSHYFACAIAKSAFYTWNHFCFPVFVSH